MKKNLNGSALVWAMITVSMLVIVVGGILTLSMVYFNKNAEMVKDTQAYFNARSGIDFVKNQLESNDYEFRDGFLTKKDDVIYKDDDGDERSNNHIQRHQACNAAWYRGTVLHNDVIAVFVLVLVGYASDSITILLPISSMKIWKKSKNLLWHRWTAIRRW